jgi:hypothetical protein
VVAFPAGQAHFSGEMGGDRAECPALEGLAAPEGFGR